MEGTELDSGPKHRRHEATKKTQLEDLFFVLSCLLCCGPLSSPDVNACGRLWAAPSARSKVWRVLCAIPAASIRRFFYHAGPGVSAGR